MGDRGIPRCGQDHIVASASKVSKVMPAVATSFKVTLPVADKFKLSVIPPVDLRSQPEFRSPHPATLRPHHW